MIDDNIYNRIIEIKAKNEIIDYLFTLKLSLHDEQIFSYKKVQINKRTNKVNNDTVLHNCSPQGSGFKENSNDLNENVINIFDELNNSFTLKNDFKQPYSKAFIDDNSESIIDFNIDPQFSRLTCETNDSIKQISGENICYICSNKMNDNNNNNNSSQQRNDTDIDFAIIQMKEPIENIMNLQTTYQDVFNISDTLQSKDTENK